MGYIKILFIVLLLQIGQSRILLAQNINSSSGSTPIIKFDLKDRSISSPIPFDKPFVLNVLNLNNAEVKSIEVYAIYYEKGKRKLSGGIPSFIIPEKDRINEKDKLIINFPALGAGKEFDILITKKLSSETIEKIYEINHIIYNQVSNSITREEYSKNLEQQIIDLKSEINDEKLGQELRDLSSDSTIDLYKKNVYDKVKIFYDSIASPFQNQKKQIQTFFTQEEITKIVNVLNPKSTFFSRVYILQKIYDDNSFEQIARGVYEIDYKYPVVKSKPEIFNFKKRLANLQVSYNYLDSLVDELNYLKAKDPKRYAKLKNKAKSIFEIVIANKKVVEENVKHILKTLNEHYYEQGVWLIGTTSVDDLKVKSGNIFSLDAGLLSIGAFNNNNQFTVIPKLYLGLNIFFKSRDKNSSNKYKIKRASTDDETHTLESQPSIWDNLCLTAGFTLGKMVEKDFDNITNGLSFTLGPSLSLFNAVRISGGVAFLKRNNTNPIRTEKQLIVGPYIGLSLDFDLLEQAKKITSLLF